MSADSYASLGSICAIDLSSVKSKDMPESVKIEKVSKAMESLFVSQLTAEFGKGLGGGAETSGTTDSSDSDNGGPYSDFIHQAMTQGVSNGGGFGLAKMIESYLTQRDHPKTAVHAPFKTPNTSYHVHNVD
jgi:Rod binding domain-containing protein